MSEVLTYTVEDGIAQVILNRPEKYNALSTQLFEALANTGEAIKKDNSVRVVVLSGSGGNFCAGLDMENFTSGVLNDSLQPRSHGLTNLFQHVAWVWHEIEVPVIAAIQGVCLGGGLQIVSGADMRYVHPESKLSIREIHWGLVPDMAGTQLWGHFVREDILRELTYTGRMFSGEEAGQFGFATRLCENPLEEALATAKEIAGKNPHAIRGCKRLINNQLSLSAEDGLMQESVEQDELIGSPNQLEAIMANFEKRAPNFADPE
ncbi:MAG: crotonase/enoyl-CoA hydratase family protein [Pseudomonadota bacterium]|nr:crotonase/enoyl-CoA hydratase family protein [Pseudomonadota bacterium]